MKGKKTKPESEKKAQRKRTYANQRKRYLKLLATNTGTPQEQEIWHKRLAYFEDRLKEC